METWRPLAVIRAASRWGGDTMILSVWLESLTFSSKVRVKWRVLTPVAFTAGEACRRRGGSVSKGPPSGVPWFAQPHSRRDPARKLSTKCIVLFGFIQ